MLKEDVERVAGQVLEQFFPIVFRDLSIYVTMQREAVFSQGRASERCGVQ